MGDIGNVSFSSLVRVARRTRLGPTRDPDDSESYQGTTGETQLNKHAQLPNIFVDFHNSDEHGRVRLNTVGTIEDLNRLGFVLCEGAEVLLYSYEVETEGTVTYSAEEGLWVANFDAKNFRDVARRRIGETRGPDGTLTRT